jgi:hypothetical protein
MLGIMAGVALGPFVECLVKVCGMKIFFIK